MRRDEESERSSVAYGSKGATKKAKKKGKKSGKSKDKDNFLIGFVVAGAAGRKGDQKQLKIDEAEVRRSGRASDAPRGRRTRTTPPHLTHRSLLSKRQVVEKTPYSAGFEMSREMTSDGAKSYCIVPTTYVPRRERASNSAERSHTPPPPASDPRPPPLSSRYEPAKLGEYVLVVYSDDPSASLDLISPASWALREVRGEWRGRSAGGCRNYPSWVMNPLYSLRAPRDTQCEVFLRQPEKPPLPAADGAYGTTDPVYDGVGFYVTRDDGELNLEDVEAQSGFERAQEVSGHCDLRANQVRATRRRLPSPNPLRSPIARAPSLRASLPPLRRPTRSTCSSR